MLVAAVPVCPAHLLCTAASLACYVCKGFSQAFMLRQQRKVHGAMQHLGFTSRPLGSACVSTVVCAHEWMLLQVIAEPGRYFAEACCTFACMVFGMRAQKLLDGEQGYDYWITDGLYGSMNNVMYDHATLTTRPLSAIWSENESDAASEQSTAAEKLYKSTVFGPTCDGLDTVLTDYSMPKLQNGDWLVFPNMGAYTLSGASKFNGINSTDVKMFYLWSQRSI